MKQKVAALALVLLVVLFHIGHVQKKTQDLSETYVVEAKWRAEENSPVSHNVKKKTTNEKSVSTSASNSTLSNKWLRVCTRGDPAWIYYVHVGKTGGSSLESILPMDLAAKREALPCLMNGTGLTGTISDSYKRDKSSSVMVRCLPQWAAQEQESPLGAHILSKLHMQSSQYQPRQRYWIFRNINTFLVTTRNPVTRVVSAFNYHRNVLLGSRATERHRSDPLTRAFYIDCFANVDALAAAVGRNHTSSKVSPKCIELGKSVLQGHGDWTQTLWHFQFHYQYYIALTLDQRRDLAVVVTRMEHLWEDVDRLDVALGGKGGYYNRKKQLHVTHGSQKYTVRSGITTREGRQAICCHMVRELAAYQTIILKAINLNQVEKEDAVKTVLTECGHDGSSERSFLLPFSWEHWGAENCLG